MFAGHINFHRVTQLEREEAKKREKIEQRNASKKDDNEEVDRSTWAKYTLGLKHQVNKNHIKGEGSKKRLSEALLESSSGRLSVI